VHEICQKEVTKKQAHVATHPKLSVKEILAATDFSNTSSKAFEAGVALAQHFGARLHVLHVAPGAAQLKTAKTKLESFTSGLTPGFEIVRAVSVGHAASEILKYAEREKIDVIAMGTHGRGALARVFMGSVAEAVQRDAPCQVLTIGPKAQAIEQAAAPLQTAHETPQSHCMVCAKVSNEHDLRFLQGIHSGRSDRAQAPRRTARTPRLDHLTST
jgi:nucleotide-binding universal stress UspA family protein